MSDYKKQTEINYRRKTRQILKNLPTFCTSYFDRRSQRLSDVTAASYSYNIDVFFRWLKIYHPLFMDKTTTALSIDDMKLITSEDITKFIKYLGLSESDKENQTEMSDVENQPTVVNSRITIEHYISAINGLFKYFVKDGLMDRNPVDAIDRMKRTEKIPIILNKDEKTRFLNSVKYGSGLTNKQQIFHEKNQLRDTTIFQLLLDTGLRISELVGLDTKDIDFEECCVAVFRKGGNQQLVYFSDKTSELLREYVRSRRLYSPIASEDALFLNKEGKRLSVRSVQKMTKKYIRASCSYKSEIITPHKLRSTFATESLEATGDIELVAEQLGHSNLSTVKTYAKYNDKKASKARNNLQ